MNKSLAMPGATLLSGRVSTRIAVAKDLESITTVGPEDPPDSAGLTALDVERIWAAALALYRTGAHPAVILTLRRHGKLVLNRAVGHAWGNGPLDAPDAEKILATVDTPYCVFSASKGFTATVAHLLVEQGVFGVDDRVADFIPGYDKHGKGATTIRHALTHRAGVPFLPARAADLARVDEPDHIRRTLCDLRPLYRPGTRLAYHALTGGYLLDEVVRAATGKNVRDVLDAHILTPLGFRWSNYGVDPTDVGQVAPSHRTGMATPLPVSLYVSAVLSGSIGEAVRKSNDPRFLTAIVPSANIVSTTTEMSRFYELLGNGGVLDGIRILSPDTLRAATTQSARLEPDLGLGGLPMRYGVGYMLGARHISLYGQHTQRAFGHLGMMNVIGWADPERALSGALITSGKAIVYPGMERFARLPQRIASRIPKVPSSELAF